VGSTQAERDLFHLKLAPTTYPSEERNATRNLLLAEANWDSGSVSPTEFLHSARASRTKNASSGVRIYDGSGHKTLSKDKAVLC